MIEFKVDKKTGRLTMEAHGEVGPVCKAKLDGLAKRLKLTTSDEERKPEFFQTEGGTESVKVV